MDCTALYTRRQNSAQIPPMFVYGSLGAFGKFSFSDTYNQKPKRMSEILSIERYLKVID
jgi:hypothetical protein